jgi:hypothetical protein
MTSERASLEISLPLALPCAVEGLVSPALVAGCGEADGGAGCETAGMAALERMEADACIGAGAAAASAWGPPGAATGAAMAGIDGACGAGIAPQAIVLVKTSAARATGTKRVERIMPVRTTGPVVAYSGLENFSLDTLGRAQVREPRRQSSSA